MIIIIFPFLLSRKFFKKRVFFGVYSGVAPLKIGCVNKVTNKEVLNLVKEKERETKIRLGETNYR